MRRSTRSSWERNGSFKSTVRWAWSFSLSAPSQSVEVPAALLGPPHEGTRAGGPGLSGGLGHLPGDVGVGAGALHLLAPLQLVEEATAPVDVVVGGSVIATLGARAAGRGGPVRPRSGGTWLPSRTPATRRGGPIRGPSGSAPNMSRARSSRGSPCGPEKRRRVPSTALDVGALISRRWPGAPAATGDIVD